MSKYTLLAVLLVATGLAGAATITWNQTDEANVANWTVRQCWDTRPCVETTEATKVSTVPLPLGKSLAVQVRANPSDPVSYSESAWGSGTFTQAIPQPPSNLRLVETRISVTPLADSATLNLSAIGVSDWKHWGLAAVGDVNSEINSGIIGTLQPIHSAAPIRIETPATWPAISWSNGSPTATASNVHGALTYDYADAGINTGFSIAIPATASPRVFHWYVGTYQTTGMITVSVDGAERTATFGSLVGPTYNDLAVTFAGSGVATISVVESAEASSGRISVLGSALE
jgi:hypothetical protein